MKLKKRYIILILIAISAIAGFYFVKKRKSLEEKYMIARVERANLKQVVSATGSVMPPSETELNYSMIGKILEIGANVGDTVKKGKILSRLDTKDLEIKVKESQANLDAAIANLSQILQGSKMEDIAVSMVNLEKAEKEYENYQGIFENIKKQAEQDVITAQENLETLKDKMEKDVKIYEEAVISAQVALTDAKQSFENTKKTKQQAIDNAKQDALTFVDTKMFVASASLNVVYEIISEDDIKYSLSATDFSYLTRTSDKYNLAISEIEKTRESLSAAKSANSEEDIRIVLTQANNALNVSFEALLNCYDSLLHSISTVDLTKTELDAHKTNIKTEQTNISAALTAIQSAKQTLDSAILDYASGIDAAQSTINTKEKSLDAAVANLSLSKTSGETQISAAENNLASTKIASEKKIKDAQTTLDSYYNQWKLMEKQLALKESSPLSAEISLYRSKISQAEAGLDAARENLAKANLTAPADGIITKRNYEVGEQINLSIPVFVMNSFNDCEIEVNIPESDIAKINKGQNTIASMDAYGDEIKFDGAVIFIEPAETIIQDVVYYKVKINLAKTAYEVKPGMTANVDIITALKDNILIMPQRAVVSGNGDKKARVLKNGAVEEVKIEIGLKGEEGMVEIISGLAEGGEVVVYEKK